MCVCVCVCVSFCGRDHRHPPTAQGAGRRAIGSLKEPRPVLVIVRAHPDADSFGRVSHPARPRGLGCGIFSVGLAATSDVEAEPWGPLGGRCAAAKDALRSPCVVCRRASPPYTGEGLIFLSRRPPALVVHVRRA